MAATSKGRERKKIGTKASSPSCKERRPPGPPLQQRSPTGRGTSDVGKKRENRDSRKKSQLIFFQARMKKPGLQKTQKRL